MRSWTCSAPCSCPACGQPMTRSSPTGVKRQHSFERIFGSLLKAEIAEKHARSIRYQLGIAKLPLAKEIEEFVFKGTPINAELVRDLAGGGFLEHQRNVVLIGGTGSGKSHLAIGIARSCIRGGAKARYFNVVDLVNKLETEVKLGRQGRIADALTRVNLLVLDELGYLPFAQWRPTAVPPDQPPVRAHLDHRHDQSRLRRMGERVRRPQDDDGPAGPAYPSLRYRRDRQRQLALQEPQIAAPPVDRRPIRTHLKARASAKPSGATLRCAPLSLGAASSQPRGWSTLRRRSWSTVQGRLTGSSTSPSAADPDEELDRAVEETSNAHSEKASKGRTRRTWGRFNPSDKPKRSWAKVP